MYKPTGAQLYKRMVSRGIRAVGNTKERHTGCRFTVGVALGPTPSQIPRVSLPGPVPVDNEVLPARGVFRLQAGALTSNAQTLNKSFPNFPHRSLRRRPSRSSAFNSRKENARRPVGVVRAKAHSERARGPLAAGGRTTLRAWITARSRQERPSCKETLIKRTYKASNTRHTSNIQQCKKGFKTRYRNIRKGKTIILSAAGTAKREVERVSAGEVVGRAAAGLAAAVGLPCLCFFFFPVFPVSHGGCGFVMLLEFCGAAGAEVDGKDAA